MTGQLGPSIFIDIAFQAISGIGDVILHFVPTIGTGKYYPLYAISVIHGSEFYCTLNFCSFHKYDKIRPLGLTRLGRGLPYYTVSLPISVVY